MSGETLSPPPPGPELAVENPVAFDFGNGVEVGPFEDFAKRVQSGESLSVVDPETGEALDGNHLLPLVDRAEQAQDAGAMATLLDTLDGARVVEGTDSQQDGADNIYVAPSAEAQLAGVTQGEYKTRAQAEADGDLGDLPPPEGEPIEGVPSIEDGTNESVDAQSPQDSEVNGPIEYRQGDPNTAIQSVRFEQGASSEALAYRDRVRAEVDNLASRASELSRAGLLPEGVRVMESGGKITVELGAYSDNFNEARAQYAQRGPNAKTVIAEVDQLEAQFSDPNANRSPVVSKVVEIQPKGTDTSVRELDIRGNGDTEFYTQRTGYEARHYPWSSAEIVANAAPQMKVPVNREATVNEEATAITIQHMEQVLREAIEAYNMGGQA